MLCHSCTVERLWQHGAHAEWHGARTMEHGALGMVHGACCKGHGAWKHGACAGWHHAMARIHGSQGMLYHSMVHASMKHRTFSPLFTVSEIRDALPHLPSPSMPLKSETQLPLITASEIRDTRPLLFTTSEIRGIRCLCFQRHVSDFIDASLILETSKFSNFRKLLITLATQEIWNLFFRIIVTQT